MADAALSLSPEDLTMARTRTVAGAAAFRELCFEIASISNDTCARLEDVPDTRDYAHMAEVVREHLKRNLSDVGADHANGFLRALTDLLCMNVDGGCVRPDDDRDPIEVTELSFSGELDQLLAGEKRLGAADGK